MTKRSWDVFDHRYKEPRVKRSHLKMMERLAKQAAQEREDGSTD